MVPLSQLKPLAASLTQFWSIQAFQFSLLLCCSVGSMPSISIRLGVCNFQQFRTNSNGHRREVDLYILVYMRACHVYVWEHVSSQPFSTRKQCLIVIQVGSRALPTNVNAFRNAIEVESPLSDAVPFQSSWNTQCAVHCRWTPSNLCGVLVSWGVANVLRLDFIAWNPELAGKEKIVITSVCWPRCQSDSYMDWTSTVAYKTLVFWRIVDQHIAQSQLWTDKRSSPNPQFCFRVFVYRGGRLNCCDPLPFRLQDSLVDTRIIKGSKRPFNILDKASGVLKPVRLPPSCLWLLFSLLGKRTFTSRHLVSGYGK